MNRMHRRVAMALAAVVFVAPLAAQDQTVDTTGVGALLDQGMNHSQAMNNLEHLTDIIGPRLTGSPAARAANDWTMQRFKDYGLDAHLESWQFGGTWSRGPMWMRMVSPRRHDVIAASWAWTPGTGGRTIAGPVVLINAMNAESLAVYRGKVHGAWVMLREPARVWNNDGPAMTAEDSAAMRARFAGVPAGQPAAARLGGPGQGGTVSRRPSLHAPQPRSSGHFDRRGQGANPADHERLAARSPAAAPGHRVP